MEREYYCTECHFAFDSNADINHHHEATGHRGIEHRDVIRRKLRNKRAVPAFDEGPSQAEIDATLASIANSLEAS